MVKLVGPHFSLDARGQLGRATVFSIWKGINYGRRWTVPQNPKSADQLVIRQVFGDGATKWKDGTITSGDKLLWNAFAEGKPFSGFDAYMKAYVADNFDPGPPVAVISPQVIPTAPTS